MQVTRFIPMFLQDGRICGILDKKMCEEGMP